MYLYFNYEGKLQTAIAHGNPIRQGDSFDLYVCFDLDFFKKNSLLNGSELLYMSYKIPSENHFSPFSVPLENKGSIKFVKNSDSEVTYKLKDGQRYITYYANISANSGITSEAGDLQLVFCFQRSAGVEYILDASTGYYHLDANATTENVLNLPAKLYIEATYSKNKPVLDGTIDIDDYNTLVNLIGTVSNEKNIALEEMDFFNYGEDPNDEYATLLDRANYIFETWVDTRIGWLIVGQKKEITLDENEQQVSTIKNTDLYLILDEENMFVISCIDGILYKYNNSDLIQLTYSKQFLDELLNITALGESLRLLRIEMNTSYGVTYNNGVFQWLKGKNKTPQNIVDTNELRQDMGVVDAEEDINSIKENATFGVEYTNKVLKAQNGILTQANPKITLFTADSLKADMDLDNVVNYGVETTPTATGDNLYITSKAVYDALQIVYGLLNGKADETEITAILGRLNSIEAIIGDGNDPDNIINTLYEVIEVLNGLDESANLLDLINAKANQSQVDAIEDDVEDLQDKMDIVYSRTNAYTEIQNSQGTIDIQTSSWQPIGEIVEGNYPYKWEFTNGYLQGATNCIVVFSKDNDTSMISTTTDIDEVNGKLIIYASELPTDTINIEKIVVFNDLNAYINYSNEIVQQVNSNTSAISDINNVKLPQYVQKEIIRGGYRTFVRNVNYEDETDHSQYVDASLQVVEGSDIYNFTNCSVSATLTGAMLSTTKVESGVATTHTLKLDTDGNLTLDGNVVGGGGSGVNVWHCYVSANFVDGEATYLISNIIKPPSIPLNEGDKILYVDSNDKILECYMVDSFDETNATLSLVGAFGGGGGHKVIKCFNQAIEPYMLNGHALGGVWVITATAIEYGVATDTATGNTPTSFEPGDIVLGYSQVEHGTFGDPDFYADDILNRVLVVNEQTPSGDVLLQFQQLAQYSESRMLTTATTPTNSAGVLTLSASDVNEGGGKVGDYISYISSGSISALYKITAVNYVNDAFVYTIDLVGNIGGGKQLYQHNIWLNYGGGLGELLVEITNDSSEEIPYNELFTYLYNRYGQTEIIGSGLYNSTNIWKIQPRSASTLRIFYGVNNADWVYTNVMSNFYKDVVKPL